MWDFGGGGVYVSGALLVFLMLPTPITEVPHKRLSSPETQPPGCARKQL